MISIIVLILICIAIEVLDKTLGDELNPFFYCLILIIAVVLVIVCMRYENQNKSTNFDSQETPTVNTQESSQVKVKENTMNLNCTALENGEYLCKKSK